LLPLDSPGYRRAFDEFWPRPWPARRCLRVVARNCTIWTLPPARWRLVTTRGMQRRLAPKGPVHPCVLAGVCFNTVRSWHGW